MYAINKILSRKGRPFWLVVLFVFNFACQLMQLSHAMNAPASQDGNASVVKVHGAGHQHESTNVTAHGLPQAAAQHQMQAENSHCMPSADQNAIEDCCQSGSLCNQTASALTLLSIDAPTSLIALLPVELFVPQSNSTCFQRYQQSDADFALNRPRIHLINCTLLN